MADHSEFINLDELPLDDRSLPFERALARNLDMWRASPYDAQLAAVFLTLTRTDGELAWRDTEQGQQWAVGLTFATTFLHWLIDHGEQQHDALSRAYPELRQLEEHLAGFAGAMKGVGERMGKL